MFINFLLLERSNSRPTERKRSEQQVSNICLTVLNFLAFLDTRFSDLNLIGVTGRIRAEQKTFKVRSSRNGKTISRTSWVHGFIPQPRKARRRQPISTLAVKRLYEANASLATQPFIYRRRYTMLRLLEITGGRRMEVAWIKIQDVEDAIETGELRVFNAKKRYEGAYRFVPVTQTDLKDIKSFIKHNRQQVIRKTVGFGRDHGYLFIRLDTGQPLEIDTHGSELYLLRKAAGIEDEEVCLHAFRHRYITNIF